MAETLSAVAARIAATPCDLVFPDTCAMLDVLRAGFRLGIQGNVISSAMRLTQRTRATPRTLWLIIPEQVKREWHDNASSVKDELTASIDQAEQQVGRIVSAAAMVAPLMAISQPNLSALQLDNAMFQVAQDMVDASLVIADDADCIASAHARVIQRIAPSSGNKQQYKDCVVVEHCLAVCRVLRCQGFSGTALEPVGIKTCILIFASASINQDEALPDLRSEPTLSASARHAGLASFQSSGPVCRRGV